MDVLTDISPIQFEELSLNPAREKSSKMFRKGTPGEKGADWD